MFEKDSLAMELRNKYILSFRDQMGEQADLEFIGTWVDLIRFGQTLRRNGYRNFQVICLEQNDDDLPF